MKHLSILLTALAVMSLPALASPVLYFDPSSTVITNGQQSTVDVDVSGASDVYYWQFDLLFDPAVLQVQSVTEGTFLSKSGGTIFASGIIDNVGGSVTFMADSLESSISGASGDGTLVSVVFEGLQSGTSNLAAQKLAVGDSGLNDISSTFSVQSGDINVQGTVQGTPEPGSALLLGGALLALCAAFRRRCAA